LDPEKLSSPSLYTTAGSLFGRCVFLLFLWSSSAPLRAEVPQFAFTNIIERSAGGFVGLGVPSMGTNGIIVFSATNDINEPESCFAIIDGFSMPVLIAGPSPAFTRIGSQTGSVNAFGTFVFSANLSNFGSGIFRTTSPGGPFTEVATSSTGQLGETRAAINASGTIAYVDDGLFSDALYAVNASGSQTLVANSATTFSVISGQVALSDDGTAVFGATLRSNGVKGLFAASTAGGGILTVADTAGVFSSFNGAPTVNARGDVAFQATLDDQTSGVYLGSVNGAPPVTIIDSTGPLQVFGQPALGSDGSLAFVGISDEGTTSLYWGNRDGVHRLLTYGDSLFGSTFSTGVFGSAGFAEDGRIAFAYTLSDGRSGIGMMTPVPEPTSGSLVASVLLLGAARRRHRGVAPSGPHRAE
jgi:hypothetical protein